MSLLLDALKKAAEQKAEKNKQETPAVKSSDETEIDTSAEEISALGADIAEDPMQHVSRGLQDETEIDNSDFDTRLERTRVEREAGDETQLQIPDPTETQSPELSAQMQTGEDETIIFADEDVADFMGEPELVSRPQRAPEDETDLSQLAPSDDQTDISQVAARDYARVSDADDTDISRPVQREDLTDIHQPVGEGDETDLSQLTEMDHSQVSGTDDTDVAAALTGDDETDFRQQISTEDETDISVPVHTADRVQSAEAAPQDETDISEPKYTADQVEPADPNRPMPTEDTDLSRLGADDSGATDDDMSLLLVEREQTNLTTPTSATDPQAAQDQFQALQEGGDELSLVDTTRHRAPTESMITAPGAEATQTTQTAPTRTEPTSTRTYAPDNYDRTLMRLPSDDASKLFAGMKSDSEVVMTPDYAKKVFRSKSSAQRLQHYKFYAGIFVAIILAIGIFGAFEYQDESETIDASLRPLKRDPMPGIIKPGATDQQINLFADSQPKADDRTLEIIESAESADGVTEGVIASEATQSAVESTIEDESTTTVAQATPTTQVAESVQAETASEAASGEVSVSSEISASNAETPSSASQSLANSAGQSGSQLQISSNSRVEQKDIWLRQAYAAYKAGNDDLAMQRYNQVLEVDPVNRNALLARAAINVQNNDAVAAIGDYRTLLHTNPKDSLAMTSMITVANYSPQETESQLKLMIRDNPESPFLNFALANAYGAQNRWQEAQNYYFKALQNNPDDPNYAYNLAVSLEHISQPKAAISYYQRALDNIGNGLATFNKDLVDQRMEMLRKL